MSWLYTLKNTQYTRVIKQEGEVAPKLVYRNNYNYRDYFFTPNTREGRYGGYIYLSTWDAPWDGYVYNRCVFLESEDDARALSILADVLKEDIRKLEIKKDNLQKTIERLQTIEVTEI